MNLNWYRQHQSKSYQGQQKQGYTVTYISDLHSLLLFGGTTSRPVQVYLYDIITRKWSIKRTSGIHKPFPRKNHTSYYQRTTKSLIVFGGETQNTRSLDTFDILQIQDWIWYKLSFKSSSIPQTRSLHTFTNVGDSDFYIFGGISLPYGIVLNDLWLFKGIDKIRNTNTQQVPGGICQNVVTKGNAPSGRYNHRAYYNKYYYYVLGGETEKLQEQQLTVYILDMKKKYWYKQSLNINIIQLSSFSLVANSQNKNQLYIFGGQQKQQNKLNNYLYSIQLQFTQVNIKRIKKLPQNIDHNIFSNCCEMPFQQILGMCCGFVKGQFQMYKIGTQQMQQQLCLQQYLKYIKNQQLLSQQLLRKVSNLQNLYKQMQIYTSLLFKQYRKQGQIDQNIEEERQKQIQNCLQLKIQYTNIDNIYQQNLQNLQKARKQLSNINQHFQGYIETQRDQDQ